MLRTTIAAAVAMLVALQAENAFAQATSIAFAPNNQHIAVGVRAAEVRLYTRAGKHLRRISTTFGVDDVVFSPDSRFLATAETGGLWDAGLQVWEAKTSRRVASLPISLLGSAPSPNSLAFIPKRAEVAAAGGFDFSLIWNYEKRSTRGYGEVASAIAVAASGKVLAYSNRDAGIVIQRVRDGQQLRTIELSRWDSLYAIAFGAKDRVLAAAIENTIRVWNPGNARLLRTLEATKKDVWALSFQPGGPLLAAISDGGRIDIWNAMSGERVWQIPANRNRVPTDIALSPNGRFLAAVEKGGRVWVWDVKQERLLRRFR